LHVDFPNIRHLRTFREVARLGGVSAASEVVFLSQPAITQAIAKLEIRIGVPLFIRQTEGMFPTEAGALFLVRINRMLDALDQGVARAIRQQGARSASFSHRITAAQLRALLALSDARNFSIVARNIGISQPSIHRAARDLERLVGFTLFNATRHGIELTAPAQTLARHARLAATELQQGYFEIEAMQGQDSTRITIGSLPLARTRILPNAMHALLCERPGVQLRNIDGPYAELLRGLRYGEIDMLIGALRDPLPADDVVQETLFDDPLAIVVRAGHPLAAKPEVSLADTLDFGWIAPPRATPAGTYLSEVLNIPDLVNTPVKVVSSSLVLVRGLLLEGEYITIISRHQVRHELDQGILVALPLPLEGNSRPIGLTFRADWKPTATQARFVALLRDAVKGLR
jgi:LysR family transcriptional regulator, regulator for genes of the gallate degradation pathway